MEIQAIQVVPQKPTSHSDLAQSGHLVQGGHTVGGPPVKLAFAEKVDEEKSSLWVLHQAATDGDEVRIKSLLQQKADATLADQSGRTPLHYAGLHGHKDVFSLLVQHGASLLTRDEDNRTAVGYLEDNYPDSFRDLLVTGVLEGHGSIWLQEILWREGALCVEAVDLLVHDGFVEGAWPRRARLNGHLRAILAPLAPQSAIGRRFSERRETSKEAFGVLYKHVDLTRRNCLHRAQVKVDLKVLPFTASLVCSKEILLALATTPNDQTLSTDAVTAMVEAAWIQFRLFTAADIFLSVVNVLLLCYISFSFIEGRLLLPWSTQALWAVAVINLKKASEVLGRLCEIQLQKFWRVLKWLCRPQEEVLLEPTAAQSRLLRERLSPRRFRQRFFGERLERRGSDWRPLVDLDNLMDVSYVAVSYLAIGRQLRSPETLEKPFMAMFSAMAWLRMLYGLRGESWLGPRFLPIIWALKDTTAFFIVTAVCYLAATHAYYNLQQQNEPSPHYAAFLTIAKLGFFGDFDMEELEGINPSIGVKEEGPGAWEMLDPVPGEDYIPVHILFYRVGLCFTILLMNLLIGVLSQNFEMYQDRAPELFNRARAKMLLEISGRPLGKFYAFLKMSCSLCRRSAVFAELHDDSWQAWFAWFFLLPVRPLLGARAFQGAREHMTQAIHSNYGILVALCFCFPLQWGMALSILVISIVMSLFVGPSAVRHEITSFFGVFNGYFASECWIWYFVRFDPSDDEVRSSRTATKHMLKELHKKHEEMNQKIVDELKKIQEALDTR